MRLAKLRRHKKSLAAILLIPFLTSLVPTQLWAITSGPAQEEFANFEPAQTTEMVNLYTGDFTYNIPLMTVPGPNGGYPINLFYNSGVSANEAGSWVGLGWNLNIGSISRQLRGLPDDFNGDEITQEMHMRRNFAVGVDVPKPVTEVFGIATPGGSRWNTQIYYNNYKGLGYRISTSLGVKGLVNVGANISFDSQNGIGIDPAVSMGQQFKLSLSASYNSRAGLRGVALQTSLNFNSKYNKMGKGFARFGGGGSSSLSFNFNGNVPDITVPTRTTHIDFDLKFASSYFWPVFKVPRWGNWQGYAEWSKLVNGGVDQRKAFGYLYNQNANSNDYRDFNRTGLEYSKKVPNLSTSAYTYDPLIVTGAGMGGQFRPYRSRPEILNTPKQVSRTDGHRINLEFASGATIHAGLGYAYTDGEQYSGPWRGGIPNSFLNPTTNTTSSPLFQDYYYQLYGEQTGHLLTEDNQLDSWLGSEPLRAKLDKNSTSFSVDNLGFFTNQKTGVNLDADNYGANPALAARPNRTPKANYIQTLTEREAFNYGFSKDLEFEVQNLSGTYSTRDKFTSAPDATSGKISEIVVNKDDGYRYVYGLPASNITQVDASFNVYPPYTNENGGSTNGDANTDVINASGHTNNNASNQFESKKTLPDYAHSWLLTHVVSPDYQDRTGDGVSNDDPGSWMKFTYLRSTGDAAGDKYKWREPYAGANFAEGQKSNPADDMASYVYGEKDLYYLRKVETPTHIAIFETGRRHDAYGVINETLGKKSSNAYNTMRNLSRIKLYVKNIDGTIPNLTTATPIQTAVFVYADPQEQGSIPELCQGVPSANSGRGKLTLERVYLTAGKSTRGQLSPYRFDYGPNDAQNNPTFNRRNRDRWGNYQDNAGLYPNSYPFIDFPYTNQYSPPNADAWQLKEITLPTGGKLKVDYEPDDYAYEMDKPAAQMFDIIKLGSNGTIPTTNVKNRFSFGDNSESMTYAENDGNYRVYVHLSKPIPNLSDPQSNGLVPSEYFKRYYLDQIDKVYYKVYANLTGSSKSTSDYVSGYADLLKSNGQYGVVSGSGNQVAYITLKKVEIQKPSFGQNIHPFRRAALDFLKLNRSELVNGYDPNESDPGNFIDQVSNIVGSIFQFFEDIMTMSMGFNRYAVTRNWASNIFLNGRSVVRLNNGSGFMYGGGNRVKSLSISNEWNQGVGSDEYGQAFEYTMDEGGRIISSGVASTPEGPGGEESALKYPVNYELSTPLASPQNLFVEKPIMKGYYPGPSVGYRKITVKSLAHQSGLDIDGSYAPMTVHEYFTHKDFPVIEYETDMSSASPIHDWAIFPLFGSRLKKHTARSQGYTIELNDMAGKLKATTQRTFPTAENPEGTLINRTEYVYNTEEEYNPNAANRLSNDAKILLPNGTMADGMIGQTHDIFHDFHEKASKANQYGADFNLDYLQFPFPPIPIIVPTLYPSININETSMRTAVTHKVIYKTALLKDVVVTDGLSTAITSNIAYDQVTAKPMLTRTTNEYKDYLYSMTEPAHWKYNNPSTGSMAGAYRNLEVALDNISCPSGFMGISGAQNVYTKGDELWVQYSNGTGEKAYVDVVTSIGIGVINESGTSLIYPGTASISVIRSGHRNMLTANAGTLQFKGSSSAGSTDVSNLTARNSHVLNTSSSTYKADWDGVGCNEYYVPDNAIDSCEIEDDMRALLEAIADPNIGPATNNNLTFTQDLTHPDYQPYITNLLWPYNTSSLIYMVFSDPVDNELYYSLRPCSDCAPYCNVRLQLSPSTNINWASVDGINYLYGNSTTNPSSFSAGFGIGTTNYHANRVSGPADDCWAFCATQTLNGEGDSPQRDIATSGLEKANTNGQSRQQMNPCQYKAEDCDAYSRGEILNPYKAGLQGAWRPHKSYAFKTDRKYEEFTNNEPRLREFGEYETFTPFNWATGANNTANGWVKSTENNEFSIYGNILEELDALDNYSAAQYGYAKQLVVGVGKNMKYREIAIDNFEDYDKDCTDHFRFTGAVLNQNVLTEEAHTGDYSIKVNSGDEGPFLIKYLPGESDPNCQSSFRPIPGNRYVLSAWVKETEDGEFIHTTTQYDNAIIRIQFCNGTATVIPDIKASGRIIDGWQRVYAEFTVPSNTQYFEMRLLNNSSSNTRAAFFDDIRIHPFDGNVNSYVYDRTTLRLVATLDENNFATFTIRDQGGQVVKYNVETEKGIVTTNEGSRYVKPN